MFTKIILIFQSLHLEWMLIWQNFFYEKVLFIIQLSSHLMRKGFLRLQFWQSTRYVTCSWGKRYNLHYFTLFSGIKTVTLDSKNIAFQKIESTYCFSHGSLFISPGPDKKSNVKLMFSPIVANTIQEEYCAKITKYFRLLG